MVIIVFAGVLLAVEHFTAETRSAEFVQASQINVPVSNPYEDDDGVARIFYEGEWYIPKDIETILVLGVDDAGKQKDYGSNINHAQADFLLLLLVDHESKQYTALQLNRDTMTEITVIGAAGDYAGTTTAQLALAHTYGSGLEDSCEYTVEAVSKLLYGIEIDHYAALSMDAIGVMNDQVGGVTVTVPVDMTKYDAALAEGATVTLNAKQAELFVRSRKDVDDSTNLSRMKRQQVFMSAWKKAMLSRVEKDAGFALESVLKIADYLVSDMTAFELSDFANAVAEYEDQGIKETVGENVVGDPYMEFYVDEDSLYQQVIDLFYQLDDVEG